MKTKILVPVMFAILLITLFAWRAEAEAPLLTKEEMHEMDLNRWLVVLATCESHNRSVVNPKDSDGLPAFGPFQYKLTTVISLAKKYKIYPNATADSAYTIAMDMEKSYHLTREVMKQNPNEYKQWGPTCRNQAGKPPVITDYEDPI